MKTHIDIFPVYRKYSNERSYFKVISETEFEEIQLTGNQLILHQFQSNSFLDRNYISDLITNTEGHWIDCDAQAYENLKLKLENT